MKKIQENFLYYIWMTRQFDYSNLKTIDGQSVVVKNYGSRNPYSGPDFSNAQIQIGDTLWAGNVEMHILSSDWENHRHQYDDAYNNVILHVVLEHDKDIIFNNKNKKIDIPTVELRSLIPQYIFDTYCTFIQSKTWIPCENILTSEDINQFDLFKYSLTTQRLWLKSEAITSILKITNYDWEKTTYILICKYFGGTANKIPFERLAFNCPLNLVHKNKHQRIAIEALYFGQAGFLQDELKDEYAQILAKEFTHLSKKYKLSPMDVSTWKFGGMRPQGLPTFRLAQFIGMICRITPVFSKIKAAVHLDELYQIFQTQVNDYWKHHYTFKKSSGLHQTKLSKSFVERLIINVVVPLLFIYGKETGQEKYVDKCITLLESIPNEQNAIINQWKRLGFSITSAFDSQASIHLKKYYCKYTKCMECKIGHILLSNTS